MKIDFCNFREIWGQSFYDIEYFVIFFCEIISVVVKKD